jgi:hypothetical protein
MLESEQPFLLRETKIVLVIAPTKTYVRNTLALAEARVWEATMNRAQYEKATNVSGIVQCLAYLAREAASLNLNDGCSAIQAAMRTLDGEFRMNGVPTEVARELTNEPP